MWLLIWIWIWWSQGSESIFQEENVGMNVSVLMNAGMNVSGFRLRDFRTVIPKRGEEVYYYKSIPRRNWEGWEYSNATIVVPAGDKSIPRRHVMNTWCKKSRQKQLTSVVDSVHQSADSIRRTREIRRTRRQSDENVSVTCINTRSDPRRNPNL